MAKSETTAGTRRGGRGARERILRAAVELFARDGIHVTGIAKLTSVAHVSTRTFYQHFPSKEALVSAYLQRVESDPEGPVHGETVLERDDLSARERLLALFAASPPAKVVRGCPLHNAAVEAAGTMPEAAALVERHKRDFTERLIKTAAEAGAREPESLGRQLAVLFEGANALSTSLNDMLPYQDARELANMLIDQAIEPN
ncbi:TetR/AcrR family transcriptional regulator [Streptomyces chromofuscus]|uniref:TetR/AcrR family transcriptional regulator n=1 Tax=Streptomyces chromofuscus TaxID=42881 RepID=A0A7M2TBB6_STRCW|nr:TetR/AcrR family transcriptional regulator [Streptomyces chromofuscus]QOV44641.1 TetR/AcrR family transcriptional regulator [Streptomyces chromofuscus]GGT01569.1 TetR family transcriptional regulator [Streptomyces chromofuscus]